MRISLPSFRFLLLIAGILFCFNATAQQKPVQVKGTDLAQAKVFIEKLMQEQHIPGLSIAIARKGTIIWKEAFGYADLDNQVKTTTDSRFRIGSVSKSLTSVGLARLIDEGKIDIDLPIQSYVPDFPVKNFPVTARELAGHTAGIRHYRDNDPTDYIHTEHYNTVKESLSIFNKDSLLFEPGTKYNYSSYGFVLLSAVMEGASGVPFDEWMKKEVFGPLKMDLTTPDYQDSIISGRTAYYNWSKFGKRIKHSPFEDVSYKWAGGGFLSTPSDLAKLGMAIISGDFLKPSTREMLMTSQKLKNGTLTNYGFGLRMGLDSKGRQIVHHGGVAYGGRAFLLLYPKEQLVITVTTNQGNAQFAEEQLEKLADLFLK